MPTIILMLTALIILTSQALAFEPPKLETLREKYQRPAPQPHPITNPTTIEKIQLGKALFFDPVLSGSNTMSCASCHDPDQSWQDKKGRSIGASDEPLRRATPTILDSAWRKALMWDGRFDTLEAQAWGPITSPAEMNQDAEALVAELSTRTDLRRKFAAAFPDQGLTKDTIAQALASFERSISSGSSAFDKWLAGDDMALSEAAKRGFLLFTGKANCDACHSGWAFTDDSFHDIGLKGDDRGRGRHYPTEIQMQRAFKTPTLRDVARRAPYMHDASIPTLQGVLKHYEQGIILRPSLSDQVMAPKLSPDQTSDLLTFLDSLTEISPRQPSP